MIQVIVNIEDSDWGCDDVAAELREVAKSIEDCYSGGLTSFGNQWEMTGMNW